MGALRRAGPAPHARPTLIKRSRCAAPAACGPVARGSSVRRADAGQESPRYTKVTRNGIVLEMEVITVVGGEKSRDARPFLKRPRGVDIAPRESSSALRAAASEELSSVPSPKRTKVTHDSVKIETEVFNVSVETFVDPAQGILRKRMAEELDALHALLRKAELLTAQSQPEAPMESASKMSPAKRRKVSPPANVAEEIKIKAVPEEEEELVDICGGITPAAIQDASPVVLVEKAGETCNSPASSSSDSDSSSSSDSDSDSDSDESSSSSDSDSDDDEGVESPAPPAVLPEENGAPAQAPPEPASEAVQSAAPEDLEEGSVDSPAPPAIPLEENGTSVQPALEVAEVTEPEKIKDEKLAAPKTISIAGLLAKAKVRRELLEMEKAAPADESIRPRDLMRLRVAEYGRPSIMRQLGLVLKP